MSGTASALFFLCERHAMRHHIGQSSQSLAFSRKISDDLSQRCGGAEPDSALWWFGLLVECDLAYDLNLLWPEFPRRSAELTAMARVHDISEALRSIAQAVERSELLARWTMEPKKQAILDAIEKARSLS